jgi:hypothetical protein
MSDDQRPVAPISLHYDGLSRPLASPRLRVLSLGAGVQSSTLALMSAVGELPPLDCAINADPKAEGRRVYEWLDWLERQLPFPVYRVSAGDLREATTAKSKWSDGRFATVPYFTSSGGMSRRQCTKEYKIEPILKKTRELLGLAYRQRGPRTPVVEQWIGISTDEIQRLKRSRVGYIEHRWPLIEARMSRADCLQWMADHGFPTPPKSACTFCPYRDNAAWRDMRDNAPDDWADAVAVDAMIRTRGTMKGFNKRQFVHRSLVPLGEANIDEPEMGPNLFDFTNECEGMCGV